VAGAVNIENFQKPSFWPYSMIWCICSLNWYLCSSNYMLYSSKINTVRKQCGGIIVIIGNFKEANFVNICYLLMNIMVYFDNKVVFVSYLCPIIQYISHMNIMDNLVNIEFNSHEYMLTFDAHIWLISWIWSSTKWTNLMNIDVNLVNIIYNLMNIECTIVNMNWVLVKKPSFWEL